MTDRTCTIDGCTKKPIARGVCGKDYMRLKREGQLPPLARPSREGHCAVDGCDRQIQARGWCRMHYKRWAKSGDLGSAEPLRPERRPRTIDGLCSVSGCTRRFMALGWCSMHYLRWRRRGSVDQPSGDEPSPCTIAGCERDAVVRGWCGKHYQRWRKYSDPTHDKRRASSAPDGTKWCPHCESYRTRSSFYSGKNGLVSWCRTCILTDVRLIEARSTQRRKRRARLAEVASEPYSNSEIADRDGWLCQVCLSLGRSRTAARIGKKKRWPHPRSLSIDHIVPVSLGGDDVRSNVQAAHLTCNISKYVNGTDQLRLIG